MAAIIDADKMQADKEDAIRNSRQYQEPVIDANITDKRMYRAYTLAIETDGDIHLPSQTSIVSDSGPICQKFTGTATADSATTGHIVMGGAEFYQGGSATAVFPVMCGFVGSIYSTGGCTANVINPDGTVETLQIVGGVNSIAAFVVSVSFGIWGGGSRYWYMDNPILSVGPLR